MKRQSTVVPEEEMAWFRIFVADSRWRFANTYVETYPHEYTLDEWCDGDDFGKAIECIERWGREEAFYSARRKYLHVDERMYWHMGNASSTDEDDRPSLINRSWVDLARYRNEAARLGYDPAAVDRLISRWTSLLQEARAPFRLRK